MGIKPTKKRPFVFPTIALSLVLLIWLVFPHWRPRENALITRFQAHRAAFNELKEMMSTNSPGQILRSDGPAWSLGHYQRYRALLRETGVIRALHKTNQFDFLMVEPASKKKGRRIAIAWLDTKPDGIVNRLDEFRKTSTELEQAYRLLDDHWYLRIEE